MLSGLVRLWERVRGLVVAIAGAVVAFAVGAALAARNAAKLYAARHELEQSLDRVTQQVDEAKHVLDEERAKRQARRERQAELDERLRRLPGVKNLPLWLVLAVGTLMALTPGVMAASDANASSVDGLPSDYDQLAALYLEAIELAAYYRDLYLEAERSNERLIQELDALRQKVEELTQTVRRQQELIEKQQQSMLRILGRVGVSAGMGIMDTHPLSLSWWVGLSYRF